MKRKQQKQNSIGVKLAIIFIAVTVVQGIFLVTLLVAGGTLSQTKINAYNHFYMQTNSRQINFENEMKNVWTNFGNYTEKLSTYFSAYRTMETGGAIDSDDILSGAAPYLLEALRSTKTTGAFLILDDNTKENKAHSAIYFRNMNPEKIGANNFTISMMAGSLDIARDLKITTSPHWNYQLLLDKSNEDFYEKAYSNMYLSAEESLLGYWCTPFSLPGDEERVITYSVPLKDSRGVPIGVFGVEISVSYLYKFLPKTDITATSQYGYILAMRTMPKGELEPIVWQGAWQKRMLKLEEPLKLKLKDKESNIYLLENHNSSEKIYCCVNEMGLYYNNTPFDNEQWFLIGLMEQSSLMEFSNKIIKLLMISIGLTVVAGVCTAVIVSRWFTRPIIDLARRIKELPEDREMSDYIRPIGMKEIDELSEAIMESQRQMTDLNEQLRRERDKDSLTGIKNRNAFNRYVTHYNSKLGTDKAFGMGVFDLNGLKLVNDSFGHEMGDIYIRQVAKWICEAFNRCYVFRIGGDEFACIFEDMDEVEIMQCNRRLMEKVEAHNKEGRFHAGVAFGYALYDAENDANLEKVLTKADANMYKNKRIMKNPEE